MPQRPAWKQTISIPTININFDTLIVIICMDKASDSTLDSPRSPLRTVELLHELGKSQEPVSLANLADRLKIPKTTLFKLLRSLEWGGYVKSSNGMHQIDERAILLGEALINNRSESVRLAPMLEQLCQLANETVILGVLDDQKLNVIYEQVFAPNNPLRFHVKAGISAPVHGSAIGQTLFAFLPKAESDALISKMKFVKLAANTITDSDTFTSKIARVFRQGFSVSIDGMYDGVYTVAAPIFNQAGQIKAGLALSAPTARGQANEETFIRILLTAGESISKRLGYVGDYPPTHLLS